MVRRWAIVFCVGAAGALALGAQAATATGKTGGRLSNAERKQLRRAAKSGLKTASTPGAVVGVQTPGGRWIKSFGIANTSSGKQLRSDVHQRIGSVAKTFTASHSNTNFVLLGLVIERVTGKPIGKVLRKRIIRPLKLGQTRWPNGSTHLPRPHARGYTLQGRSQGQNPIDATHWSPSADFTAGELISNVNDLLVYGHALATGKGLLPRKQHRERLESFNPSIPPEQPTLAYGIGLVDDNGWIGHTGDVPGFTTTVYYNPEIKTTVVVEANSDIVSGTCPEQPELEPDPITKRCANPADRVMGAISQRLGHPYQLPPG